MIRCEDLKRSICFSAANIIIRNSNLLILFPVFFLVMRTEKMYSLSNFETYNQAFVNFILSVLCITPSELTCLVTESLCTFWPILLILPTLPPLFRQPPLGSVSSSLILLDLLYQPGQTALLSFSVSASQLAVPSKFHPYCPQVRFLLPENLDMYLKCTNLLL